MGFFKKTIDKRHKMLYNNNVRGTEKSKKTFSKKVLKNS